MPSRTPGSVRFDPYWKVQTWEARSLSWKDIQQAHATEEAAWSAADLVTAATRKETRLMRITPEGRTPVTRPVSRVYATDREESDPCQAITPGCSIDHAADHGSCEGW